jgi:hypothetical protein
VRTLVLWLAAAPFAWARGRKCETNALVASCGHRCNKATLRPVYSWKPGAFVCGQPYARLASPQGLHLSSAAAVEPHRGSGVVVEQTSSWVDPEPLVTLSPLQHPLAPANEHPPGAFSSPAAVVKGAGAPGRGRR